MVKEIPVTEKWTVLVVDNSPARRTALKRILQRDNYGVSLAENGEEGLELARTSTPNIILLDVPLPGMSGIEVCKQLKADSATAAIPVIFLSATRDPTTHVEAFRAGAVDFIDASYDDAELLVRLDTHRRVIALQCQLYEQNSRLEAEVERRRRAEDDLRRRGQRLQAIIEALPDAVFVIDRDHVYREVFAAPTWTPRAQIGASVRAINADPPGLADAIEAKLETALTSQALTTLRYTQEIDGAVRHMESYGYAIDGSEVVVIDRDVTAQVEAEAALREREKRLQALIEAIPNTVVVIDRDGVYREVFPSPYEKTTAEVGQSIYHTTPDIAPALHQKIAEVLASKTLHTAEYSTQVDGETRYVESFGCALNDHEVIAVNVNITARKQAEMALQERKKRLSTLLAVQPDSLVIFDRDGVMREVYASSVWKGQSRVGADLTLYGSPEWADEIKEVFAWVHDSGALATIALTEVIDGVSYDREARVVTFDDDHVLAAIRDVTEQRRAENALKESEARMQAILRAVPDTIVVLDLEGNYREVYPSAEKRPAAKVGLNVADIFPPHLVVAFKKAAQRSLREGVVVHENYTVERDGELRHHDNRGFAADEHTVVVMTRDVTEQRRTENALKESEARMQAILRAVPDTIVVLDLEGNYREVYPSAEWRPAAKVGMNVADIFPPDLVAGFKEAAQRSLREGVVEHSEYTVEKDGELRHHENRGFAADEHTVVVATRDITDRKKLELERERLLRITERQRDLADKQIAELEALRRDLEQANRLKREFLANMSHELRTPLTAILGFSEVLEMGLSGPLNETQGEYIGNIYQAGKHLLDLINDILDLSKIEAGKMEIHAETVDLAELIKSSLTIVQERAQKAGVRLRNDCRGELSLQADARKVKQMLYNYLSNAVKFTPSGGTVTLSAWRDDDELLVSVADTGPGIAREQLEQLFREFSQLGNEQTRSSGGTGLGLALVKQLAELHGGRVWVESELGAGSCFGFALPHVPQPSGAPLQGTDEPANDPVGQPNGVGNGVSNGVGLEPSTRQGTVMIVDDTIADLRLLSDLLARHGYDVRPFDDPREALDAALQQPPDLLMLDVTMPEMTGPELAKEMRARAVTAEVPILFVTVHEDEDTIVDSFKVGNDYIVKPFVRAEVLARVGAQLELARLRRRQSERLDEVETLYAQVNEQARALKKLSSEDSLTGLANRRTLNSRLDTMVRYAATQNRPLSVLMIDIDHFKQVNDRFSHAVGDEVIEQVAEILAEKARDTDLVARYGGEEFTVLLPDTPVEAALQVAERMRASIETFDWETVQAGLTLTVSLGVASIWGRDGDAEPPERLLDLADDNLYKAKQQGRNRVVS